MSVRLSYLKASAESRSLRAGSSIGPSRDPTKPASAAPNHREGARFALWQGRGSRRSGHFATVSPTGVTKYSFTTTKQLSACLVATVHSYYGDGGADPGTRPTCLGRHASLGLCHKARVYLKRRAQGFPLYSRTGGRQQRHRCFTEPRLGRGFPFVLSGGSQRSCARARWSPAPANRGRGG